MEWFLPWLPDDAFSRSMIAAHADETRIYLANAAWLLAMLVLAMEAKRVWRPSGLGAPSP